MESAKTILYYTSNREDPNFERKIQDNILNSCGDIPIVSVSQKPIDFGKNICVGDVGHSYLNEFRQILIGAKEAKTEYLIFTEADFLYPPEYFKFEPTGGNIYRYDNVWIIFKHRPTVYFKKQYSIGAQICKREFIIKELEKYLEGQPEWADGKFSIRNVDKSRKIDYNDAPFEYFSGENACISFKTGDSMSKRTIVMNNRGSRASVLPYWGNCVDLCKKYL